MPHDVQLHKNHIIGDGGEAEKNSSLSPPEKKQKLDEKSEEEEMEDSDGAKEEDDEESDGIEDEDMLTSEHDPDDDTGGYFMIGPERVPNSMKSDYLPDGVEEVDVDTWIKYRQEIIESEGTHYSFEKLEKANVRLWDCGASHYLPFQAKESVADASKTLQALVWWGIDSLDSLSTVVKFCRLKEAAAATGPVYAVLSMSS